MMLVITGGMKFRYGGTGTGYMGNARPTYPHLYIRCWVG